MPVIVTWVDAFTRAPFGGNPAAVCLLPQAAEPAWMQRVAHELHLSETAFLVRRGDGAFDLRWFTPTVEVDLCGHATLASAHALWEARLVAADAPAVFHTRSGRLTAVRAADGWIAMDFPAEPDRPAPAPAGLADALGLAPVYVGRTRFDYLVAVETAEAVRQLAPDVRALAALPVRGVIVTAPGDTPAFDIVSRFFAPRAGIDEDPVTGSAHCSLGPFWQRRLGLDALTAHQASARGGVVRIRLAPAAAATDQAARAGHELLRSAGDRSAPAGQPPPGRVTLSGQAVTVLHGALRLPPERA